MSKRMNAQTQYMLDQLCASAGGLAAAVAFNTTAARCDKDSWTPHVAGIATAVVVGGGLMWLHRAISEL